MGWFEKLVKSGVINPQTGAIDFQDSPAESGMAMASAAAKTAQPGSVNLEGSLAEPRLNEGASMTPGPIAATTPEVPSMVTPPDPTAISYGTPPAAPQPSIVKPTFQQASTDANGMPAGNTPGLTRLGKLMQVLQYAAKGGLAGRAASEQAVAQSGGHRGGGFGGGFEAGLTEPAREATMNQQVERGAMENATAKANLAALPWMRVMQQQKAMADLAESQGKAKTSTLVNGRNGIYDAGAGKVLPGTGPAEKQLNQSPQQVYADSVKDAMDRGLTGDALMADPKVQSALGALNATQESKGEPKTPFQVWYQNFKDENKREPSAKEITGFQHESAAATKIVLPQDSTTPEAPTTIDPESQSILAQTGLSLPAFYALVGNTSQLSRDKVTRQRAMKEAQDWSKAHGVDVSTMASQYKTYNEVLGQNIGRLNRTKIMEQELQGTIQNLQGVVKAKDLGNLKFTNVAKIWAGQEVNDDLAQQYAMHLYQLRNELAAYGAATQGRSGNEITLQDTQEAERTIKSGIAKGSLAGLATAVENSTSKMGTVMQNSVNVARKSIWDLFGVGQHYKSPKVSGSSTPENNQGGSTQVIDPRGHVHLFATPEAASAFRAAAGIQQ